MTGPRQAGKTTLLKQLYSHYRYISFEDPSFRQQFNDDLRAFLDKYDKHVIFDEAQRVPDLFSYLQGAVDNDRSSARYIISGSQNFLLHRGITQLLAGRVGIVRIFPLDYSELRKVGALDKKAEAALHRGFYPKLFQTDLPARFFHPNYLSTYLERDISPLISRGF